MSQFKRRGLCISNNVVHVGGAAGSRVPEPHNLNGSWTECKDLVSGALGVPVHVEENMNAILIDTVGRLAVAGNLRKVDEVFGLATNLLSECRVVISRQTRNKENIKNRFEDLNRMLSFQLKSGLLRGLCIHHRLQAHGLHFILLYWQLQRT